LALVVFSCTPRRRFLVQMMWMPSPAALAALFLALTIASASSSPFHCYSDVKLGPIQSSAKKGLALDDATFRGCPSKIPGVWPNAEESVKTLRLFKAWNPQWPDADRKDAWEALRDFVHDQGAKVLVGTQVTCDPVDDYQDWAWVKELLGMIGAEHIMGVAIGNELDILYTKEEVKQSCIEGLWSGGFWTEFDKRVQELKGLGLGSVPVTTVFTGGALGFAATPFVDTADAGVNTFLQKAVDVYGARFVFTFNFYPYFDPNFAMDAGAIDQCNQSLTRATCFDVACSVPSQVASARGKIHQLTGSTQNLLWVGETGWSSPLSDSLDTAMAKCPAWSSEEALRAAYDGFLDWDLETSGASVPDHAFYFTVRDSNNFGIAEHFGLMSSCAGSLCKLRSPSYKAPRGSVAEDGHLSWISKTWFAIGAVAAALGICCFCSVRYRFSLQESEQEYGTA